MSVRGMWCHLLFGVPFVMAALLVFLLLTTALPLALALGIGTAVVVYLGVAAFYEPVATGPEAMVGRSGEAVSDLNPEGLVRIGGELWLAEAQEPITRGAPVQILEVRGAKVRVRVQAARRRVA